MINATIACLHRIENYNNSINDKYTWVQVINKIENDALFGLIYFRDLLGVNLLLKSILFSPESYFALFLSSF